MVSKKLWRVRTNMTQRSRRRSVKTIERERKTNHRTNM